MKVKSLSRVRLCATPWTAAHKAPLSMGFSRQEYWSGVPLPSPQMRPETLNIHVSLGSFVHGIFQARVLGWGAIAFSEYLPSNIVFMIILVIH